MTTSEIAHALGLRSPSTVNYHLKRLGVAMRPVGANPKRASRRDETIRTLFADGLSDAEIGQKLGFAEDTVRKYRYRSRILRAKGGAGFQYRNDTQTREIVRLRAQGKKWREIAAHFGITISAAAAAMVRYEASFRLRNVDHAAWIQAYQDGASLTDIAIHFGVTSPSVLNALRKAGVSTRSPDHKYERSPESTERRRAARLKARGVELGHTEAEWAKRFEEYKGCCAYCGVKPLRIVREHVITLTKGGTDEITNVVPACARCNVRKSDRLDWKPMAPDQVRIVRRPRKTRRGG